MAGRWIRKWSLSGCVLLGAVGCNKNAVQTSDAQPVSGMPMTSASGKSFWPSPSPSSSQPVAEVPAEPARKGPALPETDVAFANVHLEVALDEKTPDTQRAAQFDMARQGYQRALQKDPKNKAALLGLARYYARNNEREKSLEVYQKYLHTYPGDRDVVHEVAIAHARWKDFAGAVAWCDKALKLDPENLTFRKTMAFCLARGGRWEESFAVFCKVMPEAQARYNIARVMEDQNFRDASRIQLQLALQADPNLAEARDMMVELDHPTPPAGVADPNAVQKAGYVQE
jgi:tetratricopeptide (TPR) repeat protein